MQGAVAPCPRMALWMGEAVPFSAPACPWLDAQGWVVPPRVVLRSSSGGSDGASGPEPRMGLGGGRGVLGPWRMRSRAPWPTRTLPQMVTTGHRGLMGQDRPGPLGAGR